MGQMKAAYVLLSRNIISLNKWNGTKKRMSSSTLSFIAPQESYKVLSNSNTKVSFLTSRNYEIVVVGGGIIGVATARELLQRYKQFRMAVVEKENKLGKHQTGNNSGVVHAGIYYPPGSLKAKLCVEGMKLAYEYFDKNGVPYKKVGKLIVATNDKEVLRLDELYNRALQNKVPGVRLLGDINQIHGVEPHCVGKKAIWSPETGIVDYALVTEYYARDFKTMGGKIYLQYEITAFEENKDDDDYPIRVINSLGEHVNARYVLTCAGLQSDQIAQKSGGAVSPCIVPIRGEYLQLRPERRNMISCNIYPVPDPRFPFLGVHFTPRMNGEVWLGPNAVLAFNKEGYKRSDFNMSEFLNVVRYPGFRKLVKKHVVVGIGEALRSLFPQLQVRRLQRFVPELKMADIVHGTAGVRAQALDENGELAEDFRFELGNTGDGRRVLHCRNAPSPGATSALAIAKMMADRVRDEFQLKG